MLLLIWIFHMQTGELSRLIQLKERLQWLDRTCPTIQRYCPKLKPSPQLSRLWTLCTSQQRANAWFLHLQVQPEFLYWLIALLLISIGFTNSIISISIYTVKFWNYYFLWTDKTGVPPSNPTAGPWFHVGSFIGGMMLAFIIILVVTLGYRLACSQREVRYRLMWVPSEHPINYLFKKKKENLWIQICFWTIYLLFLKRTH